MFFHLLELLLPIYQLVLTALSYDTFALRDILGAKTLSLTYPYFASTASLTPLLNLAPIPVRSCWNGIVSFDAASFYTGGSLGKGLRFRGVDDSLAKLHLEGSECCMFPFPSSSFEASSVHLCLQFQFLCLAFTRSQTEEVQAVFDSRGTKVVADRKV